MNERQKQQQITANATHDTKINDKKPTEVNIIAKERKKNAFLLSRKIQQQQQQQK